MSAISWRWAEVSGEFRWIKQPSEIENRIINDEGLLFLANEAKRFMEPYVPADNLVLAHNVDLYVEGDAGIVHYVSPYAHYQYEGVAYGPNYPLKDGGEVIGFYSPPHKAPTGQQLDYSHARHPLATSKWDKAMKTARGDDLAKAYENHLKGR